MMAPTRADIAQLIASLDHPDGVRQRELMDTLLALLHDPAVGHEALDTAVANLRLATQEARVPLVRVLSEYAHPDTLLPLMRFVFDTRGKSQESDARGLAMQAIMRISTPENASKIFTFLMDIKQDDDPFVRGYAAEALAQFGDQRARPILEGMVDHDQHSFVKERASQALLTLQATASSAALAQESITGEELLMKIRGAQGKDRDYWLGILREREDSFELLESLITDGATKKDTLIGLRQLLDHPDPRARQLAVSHMRTARDGSERAICLRILANHLRGDATPEELKIIHAARYDSDLFVQRAALKAATASGNQDMLKQAIEVLMTRDELARAEVAAALPNAGAQALARHQPRLREALERAQRARLQSASEELERIEANILQALATFAGEATIGRRDLQRDALRSLREAATRWPIVVSALKLLRETTTQEPELPEESRWSGLEAATLLDLLPHENPKVRERALELLRYGAPAKWSMMTSHLEQMLHDEDAPVATHIIPLLEQIGDKRAEQLLEDLSLSRDQTRKDAALAALRRLRNDQKVVDATFVEPDDFF